MCYSEIQIVNQCILLFVYIYIMFQVDMDQGLNPDAAEFVPRCIRPSITHEQER